MRATWDLLTSGESEYQVLDILHALKDVDPCYVQAVA
ncbi:putative isomerase [Escherichia coli TA255]|nr:putative isomerase [Escherichia coli TA255]